MLTGASGTSVDAFCILPPNLDAVFITTQMNVTFHLDGEIVGTFYRLATTDQWTYNHNVFSKSGLKNTKHTFVISPQGQDGNISQSALISSSYIVFDYIAYE